MPLTIQAINHKDLYKSKSWTELSDTSLEIVYTQTLANGEPGLHFILQEDVTEFLHSLANTQFLIIGLFVLLGFIGVAATLFILQRNLFSPMKTLKDAMASLADGDLSVDIEGTERTDELGSMTNALMFFIFAFKDSKRLSIESSRIKVALQNAATPMLMLDAETNVIFSNNQMDKLVNQYQHDIATLFIDFDPEKLNGINFGDNFKNFDHNKINSQTELCTREMHAGERRLKIIFAPVISKDDGRIGTVMEWHDLTESYLEEERKQLQMQEVGTILSLASQGDLEARIDIEGKEGFFFSLSDSLNNVMEIMNNTFSEMTTAIELLSQDDLSYQIKGNFPGEFDKIKQSFNKANSDLANTIKDILSMSTAVLSASQEIALGNQDLNDRTVQQAAALEQTSSSMLAIADASESCASEAQSAAVKVDDATKIVESGKSVASRAVIAMTSISESSQEVMSIIDVINEIAFQTNLLALNAAVEAARAGEQGRGFAVVASEVRSLAQRSSSAADQIKKLLETSKRLVSEGTSEVNATGDMLSNIAETITSINSGMKSINIATSQQSQGVHETKLAINQMDDMTQQNAAMVEEIASTSESMVEQAEQMKTAISYFKF